MSAVGGSGQKPIESIALPEQQKVGESQKEGRLEKAIKLIAGPILGLNATPVVKFIKAFVLTKGDLKERFEEANKAIRVEAGRVESFFNKQPTSKVEEQPATKVESEADAISRGAELENFAFPKEKGEPFNKQEAARVLNSFIRANLPVNPNAEDIKLLLKNGKVIEFLDKLEELSNFGEMRDMLCGGHMKNEELGQMLFYNIVCKKEKMTDPHTIQAGHGGRIKVSLPYTHDTPLAEIREHVQREMKFRNPGDVVILGDHLGEGIWVPIDLDGEDDKDKQMWEMGHLAIAIPKGRVVYDLGMDSKVQEAHKESLQDHGMEEID